MPFRVTNKTSSSSVQTCIHKDVTFFQLHGDLAVRFDIDEVRQLIAADIADPRRKHGVEVAPAFLIFRQRHHRRNKFTFFKRQEVNHRFPTRLRATER